MVGEGNWVCVWIDRMCNEGVKVMFLGRVRWRVGDGRVGWHG